MTTLSAKFREFLYRQHRFLVVNWMMFFIALGFYLLMPEIAAEYLPAPVDYPYTEQIRSALWVIAIVTAAFLVWVKSRLHTIRAMFQDSRRPMEIRSLRGDTPGEKNAARLVVFYRSRMIVAFTLAEMIAIFGLVLALIGNYTSDQQGLSLLSACLLVYFYPSKTFFEELINEYERREARRA